MVLTVNSNVKSGQVRSFINQHENRIAQSMERLSSGLRINSAADDVSVDKMELRGGLWHVKGETKPFTGKVTLWTPGRGNEIARQVVKTYVNGKEQGSKVHILIGKRAPMPNR